MRTTKLAFLTALAMSLSAGAAYTLTPDGGFSRSARADSALDPLALLEPDSDWFRPAATEPELAPGGVATNSPASFADPKKGIPDPIFAFADPKPELPVRSAPPVHRNPKPAPAKSRSSKVFFENERPAPRIEPPPAQAQALVPVKMAKPIFAQPPQQAFPQQAAFPQQMPAPAPTGRAPSPAPTGSSSFSSGKK